MSVQEDRPRIVGIDVGGTFTDVVLFDIASGQLTVAKSPSTPDNQSVGVMNAIRSVETDLDRLQRVAHGTTVATNALLQRKLADVALVTTKGFRDTIEIGRTRRMVPSLYDPTFVRPKPLVPRPLRFEVSERLDAEGNILVPLDLAELDGVTAQIRDAGVAAVAICFLHAYTNAEHERAAAQAIRAVLPGVAVVTSAEVVSEFREYERFSTTVINASLMPVMSRYINALDRTLAAAQCGGRLYTMSSSGGTMDVEAACHLPVRTILSGPAGGIAGSLLVANAMGLKDFITCDMGGTSTDVCLVEEGQPATVTEVAFAGYPIKGMQICINTVGAGGGSIAFSEAGNTLRVGPLSAGAEPGPACYGRGGMEPTVTDANVVLNRIGTNRRLGGHIKLDKDRAVQAVARLAGDIGVADVKHLAEGIIRIAVTRMASAIREITIEKGHNPSDFALMAFGGAGPMHGTDLAEELGIREVVVPIHPGNLSALGLTASDQKYDLVRTWVRPLATVADRDLQGQLDAATAEAAKLLTARGFVPDAIACHHAIDMRYARQAFEITVTPPNGPLSQAGLRAAFLATYEKHYGHVDHAAEIEIVNIRTTAVGRTSKPALTLLPASTTESKDAVMGQMAMIVSGKEMNATVYDRSKLPLDQSLAGPAIIEELGSTTVVLPNWNCRRDAYGNLRLTRR